MKKLVRLDIDVWTYGMSTDVKPVTRETEGAVYVVREKTVRDHETHQMRTIRAECPFWKRDLRMSSSRPGTRRVYFLTEAEVPVESEEFHRAAARAIDAIYAELRSAHQMLSELRRDFR